MKNNIKLIHKLTILLLIIFAIKNSYSSIKSDRANLGNLAANLYAISPHIPATLQDLLKDFNYYITNNIHFHSGNLYQHSIWVSNVIAYWWKQKTHWVENIDPKDQNLSIFIGLIHDIGKGGDLKAGPNRPLGSKLHKFIYDSKNYYPFYDKKIHPKTGFDYILKRSYKFGDHKKILDLDYNDFFDKLKISDEERKLIAIIVGIHWDFGGIIFRRKTGVDAIPNDEDRYKMYLDHLRCLAINAKYKDGKIDERLIRLALLVSAADTLGTVPIDPKSGFDISNPTKNIFDIKTPGVPGWEPAFTPQSEFEHFRIKDSATAYIKYGYGSLNPKAKNTLGEKYKDGIINYFKSPTYQATLSTEMDKKSCMKKFVENLER